MKSQSIRGVFGIATVVAMILATTAVATVQAGGASYVKAVPACRGAAKLHKGYASCHAMRLVKVTKGTPGAVLRQNADASYAAGPGGGLTPGDLATAYGINPDTVTGVKVGIVDAFDNPNALVDLNHFNAQYGLPAETATSFKKVNQAGAAAPLPAANAGWAAEISLDLQAVRGLCHKCQIILVEANSNSFADLSAAENRAVLLGAGVVSNSFGGAESAGSVAATSAAFNHPGVVILASTGDDGMYDWDRMNTNPSGVSSNAPSVPSSLNTVVAVGGTTLYLNFDATRSAETVWNENGANDVTGWGFRQSKGATGGGCSTQVIPKAWQGNVANYGGAVCAGKRLAGDIAALADPFTGYDIYNTVSPGTGWATYGGTSLASPLIGAMWAMAGGAGASSANAPGGAKIPYPSLSLYGHFKSDGTHPLYDVTAGGNAFCAGTPPLACRHYWAVDPNTLGYGKIDCSWLAGSATLNSGTRECNAATGYDGPSGVGTPIGLNAFKPMYPNPVMTRPATITHGVAAAFSSTGSSDPFPGGTIVSYRWDWGDGSPVATTASASHTYAAAGARTVKLMLMDNYGQSKEINVPITVN
jgi:subtilase family serine protease